MIIMFYLYLDAKQFITCIMNLRILLASDEKAYDQIIIGHSNRKVGYVYPVAAWYENFYAVLGFIWIFGLKLIDILKIIIQTNQAFTCRCSNVCIIKSDHWGESCTLQNVNKYLTNVELFELFFGVAISKLKKKKKKDQLFIIKSGTFIVKQFFPSHHI